MTHIQFAFLLILAWIVAGCQYANTELDTFDQHEKLIMHRDSFKNGFQIRGGLLLSDFHSYESFANVTGIVYKKSSRLSLTSLPANPAVYLTSGSGSNQVTTILSRGVKESDFWKAREGNLWDKIQLAARCPHIIWNKRNLLIIDNLGRRRPWRFGRGDVAFYDIAEIMVDHISDKDIGQFTKHELSEKGYLNSFNHITAQAFITSIFSEHLADFIADVHERNRMPELITGEFSLAQSSDLDNGAVDNYIDILNNEWGQELGKILRHKYAISKNTTWTPTLLTHYLNDIQSYLAWSFHIHFTPFFPQDDVVIQFSNKINHLFTEVRNYKSNE